MPLLVSQGIAEFAVNMLDTLLELQQLLAGSFTSFIKLVLYRAGSATRFTRIQPHAWHSVSFPIQHRYPHPKVFPTAMSRSLI